MCPAIVNSAKDAFQMQRARKTKWVLQFRGEYYFQDKDVVVLGHLNRNVHLIIQLPFQPMK